MAEPLVSDALWALIAPLLPERPPRPKGGRPPLDDRKALAGIVFVLRTGIPWARLPKADGLRLRHDLLAPAARLAGGRGLRAAPPRAARPARPGERDRLRPLLARQRLVPGQKGGELHRPEPDRPRQAGHQAPRAGRRRAASRSRSCSAPRTSTTAGSSSRCSTPCRRSGRRGAAAQAPGQAARRQRLRLRPLPPGLPQARASSRASPGAGSRAPSGWAGTAGWSSGRWPGSPASAGSRSATSAGPTSCLAFHLLAAALICLSFVRRWRCPAPQGHDGNRKLPSSRSVK